MSAYHISAKPGINIFNDCLSLFQCNNHEIAKLALGSLKDFGLLDAQLISSEKWRTVWKLDR
jgi:hypothetical protein